MKYISIVKEMGQLRDDTIKSPEKRKRTAQWSKWTLDVLSGSLKARNEGDVKGRKDKVGQYSKRARTPQSPKSPENPEPRKKQMCRENVRCRRQVARAERKEKLPF